jgi:hypothetical protein
MYYRLKDIQFQYDKYMAFGYNSRSKDEIKESLCRYLSGTISMLEEIHEFAFYDKFSLDYLCEYTGVELEESNEPFDEDPIMENFE